MQAAVCLFLIHIACLSAPCNRHHAVVKTQARRLPRNDLGQSTRAPAPPADVEIQAGSRTAACTSRIIAANEIACSHIGLFRIWQEARWSGLLTSREMVAAERTQADVKRVGDEAFRRGVFQEAVDAYGQALSVSAAAAGACDPQQRGALLANRCLALLKLGGQAHQALDDAQQACKLRPRWGKAHLRLAQVGGEQGAFACGILTRPPPLPTRINKPVHCRA